MWNRGFHICKEVEGWLHLCGYFVPCSFWLSGISLAPGPSAYALSILALDCAEINCNNKDSFYEMGRKLALAIVYLQFFWWTFLSWLCEHKTFFPLPTQNFLFLVKKLFIEFLWIERLIFRNRTNKIKKNGTFGKSRQQVDVRIPSWFPHILFYHTRAFNKTPCLPLYCTFSK